MKLLKKSAILGLGLLSAVLGSDLSFAGSAQEGWVSQGWPQWHPQRGHHPLASAGTQIFFGEEAWMDSDGDGVPDSLDQCPGTPKGTKVDATGCPIVEPVKRAAEPAPVMDSDGDGVPDDQDQCPHTPRGVKVDSRGCPLDSDGDGVLDHLDKCPNTPKGAAVTSEGCWVIKNINFRTRHWDIPANAHTSLNEVVKVLKENPGLRFEIQGHTDNRGSQKTNATLSGKRANSVKGYLVKHGISARRLTSKGYGSSHPIADNKTSAGRAENRRVELKEIQ